MELLPYFTIFSVHTIICALLKSAQVGELLAEDLGSVFFARVPSHVDAKRVALKLVAFVALPELRLVATMIGRLFLKGFAILFL